MPSGEEYRRKAVELCEKANREPKLELSKEYEVLAFAYIRLAEMAERNALLDPEQQIDPD
jgi:hypothetical protein